MNNAKAELRVVQTNLRKNDLQKVYLTKNVWNYGTTETRINDKVQLKVQL